MNADNHDELGFRGGPTYIGHAVCWVALTLAISWYLVLLVLIFKGVDPLESKNKVSQCPQLLAVHTMETLASLWHSG